MSEPFRVIDLFSGAGGLSLGFTQVRTCDDRRAFIPIWANDFNTAAAATYNLNFGDHCIAGDLLDILTDPEVVVPAADLVIGGPPCQGFSLLNKKRQADPRKKLWRPYMEVVERSGARAFVMENVRQLLSSDELREIQAEARRLGFQTTAALLCAADYGTPQERYRAFVVGFRDGSPRQAFPPRRTHFRAGLDDAQHMLLANEYTEDAKPWRTVRNAIGNLPEPEGTEIRQGHGLLDLHFGRNPNAVSKKRYRAVPPGGNRFDLQANALHLTPDCWIRKKKGGTDLFGRLWWDRPSVTIRTEFFKPEKGRYLHPVSHRPITHREAARLQSFPDDFEFTGSKIEIARQIGNAVPPSLAHAVGRSVYALLSGDADLQRKMAVREPSPAYA